MATYNLRGLGLEHERTAKSIGLGFGHPSEAESVTARAVRSADELDCFFSQSLDLLCIATLDGYLTRLNPMWTACLGWSIEQLAAEPFLHFMHPTTAKRPRPEWPGVARV